MKHVADARGEVLVCVSHFIQAAPVRFPVRKPNATKVKLSIRNEGFSGFYQNT